MEMKIDFLRYASSVRPLEEFPRETGKILLYGSSFFAHWGYERSALQLKKATGGDLEVINHGFGGAVVDELLYYYPRLVRPYAPRAVVIRSGYNEINHGQSPRDAVFLLKRLVTWIHTDFPEIPVIILKTFHCKRDSAEAHEKMQEYNRILDQVFVNEEQVCVWDITPFFYETPADMGDRSKLRDVFIPDGLHLSDEAYVEMADYLGNRLAEKLLP